VPVHITKSNSLEEKQTEPMVSISDFVGSRVEAELFTFNSRPLLSKAKSDPSKTIFEKAKELAAIYGGKCVSTHSLSNCKGRSCLRFNCLNGHNFYLTEEKIKRADTPSLLANWRQAKKDLRIYQNARLTRNPKDLPRMSMSFHSDSWCSKCFDYYQQTKKIATQNGLKAIGGLFSSQITIVCQKRGHMF